MPIVTIQITREGTTPEQKAALIKGAMAKPLWSVDCGPMPTMIRAKFSMSFLAASVIEMAPLSTGRGTCRDPACVHDDATGVPTNLGFDPSRSRPAASSPLWALSGM